MNKSNALKAVVILQAVCLIVLAVIVVVRIGPEQPDRPFPRNGGTARRGRGRRRCQPLGQP